MSVPPSALRFALAGQRTSLRHLAPPPRGQTLLLVTLCFQAWLGEGHSLFCFGFSAGQELGLSGLAPPLVADVI